MANTNDMSDKLTGARARVIQAASQAYHELGEEFEMTEFARALDDYTDVVRLECSSSPLAAIESRVKALESRWEIQDEHERESAEYD